MKIEIVQTDQITAYVGIRATDYMSNFGNSIKPTFSELAARRDEIKNVINPNVKYGITPPNYKGNERPLDFYCCYQVSAIANVPYGMIHIHLLPRLYSVTHYMGPASQAGTAYDFTSAWYRDNGYTYDDVDYYLERYDEKTRMENDDPDNEIQIYCPLKRDDP
jgi:predicted transcriptional regulator YdeE